MSKVTLIVVPHSWAWRAHFDRHQAIEVDESVIRAAGFVPVEEVEKLRARVAELENRLGKFEGKTPYDLAPALPEDQPDETEPLL
jgi:hypothetical protein